MPYRTRAGIWSVTYDGAGTSSIPAASTGMNGNMQRLILVAGLLAVALTGCGGIPGSTTGPSSPAPTLPSTPAPIPTPTPTPGGSGTVTSVAHAAALVFASDPRWAQMIPLRPDMIGQSSWYEAFESADGFTVNITVGQGDCQAGCIDRHTWQYNVDQGGTVELVGEDGPPIAVQPGGGGEDQAHVTIQLTAGPVCPVETVPPDPNCAARAVSGADVTIFKADGSEVATTTSDGEGNVVFEIPAGAYYVVAGVVEGLMGTPEAQAFAVLGGDQVGLLFGYDTGIR